MGFFATFEEQLQLKHSLYILANAIDWKTFEGAFSPLYSSANPRRFCVNFQIIF